MPNILVIKHGAFGDFVQALGCLRAIRKHHPSDRITLMTTAPFEALARASGYVDDVYIDVRPKWYKIGAWVKLRGWLNAQNFAFVYDLQNSKRTSVYFELFSPVPDWNGIVKAASYSVEDGPARKAKHVFQALVDQLSVASITPITPDDLSWIEADISSFNLPARYVLVAAGCSAKHPAKRWPVDRYAQLCVQFVAKGITPVLLGTNDEADVNTAIKAVCPEAIDLTGHTTLFQIAVMARGAVAAVGNDTGPIQMIGPTGCKTLGLYPGFSNPARHGPLGANVTTIQRHTMADITLDQVWHQVSRACGLV